MCWVLLPTAIKRRPVFLFLLRKNKEGTAAYPELASSLLQASIDYVLGSIANWFTMYYGLVVKKQPIFVLDTSLRYRCIFFNANWVVKYRTKSGQFFFCEKKKEGGINSCIP